MFDAFLWKKGPATGTFRPKDAATHGVRAPNLGTLELLKNLPGVHQILQIHSFFFVRGGGMGGGGFLYKRDEYILAIPEKATPQGSIVSTPDPSLEHLHPFEGLGFKV